MDEKLLENYAELIVKVGVNLQKGQHVYIICEPEHENFVSILVKHCYLNGAKNVIVDFSSNLVKRNTYLYSTVEDQSKVNVFEEAKYKYLVEENACRIWLDGANPDALDGVDINKVSQIRKHKMETLIKYIRKLENRNQWTIVGVPTKKWAKKVFPNLDEDEAVENLFISILKTSRADDYNAIENWKKHQINFENRCQFLNSLNLKSLHYKSKKGTDLKVGLIKNVQFAGGQEKTLAGISFQPNIPTEECFTSPKKGEAEGIVYATKPLVYQGQLIDDFYIKFKDGKAVEVNAKIGQDALESILTLDAGSSYLGECALVPYNSPINNTGILFYNTLFDENASCHLALGKGFTNLYKDYEKYTEDELHKFGINNSFSHVDFMIGDDSLDITGTREDNTKVKIFKNGDWAF